MSTRKPSTARQRGAAKKSKLKDLAPKASAAARLKGGPAGNPWAHLKGKNS